MNFVKFIEASEAQRWSSRRLHQIKVASGIVTVFVLIGVTALWSGATGMGWSFIFGGIFFFVVQLLVGLDQDTYHNRAMRLYGDIIEGK